MTMIGKSSAHRAGIGSCSADERARSLVSKHQEGKSADCVVLRCCHVDQSVVRGVMLLLWQATKASPGGSGHGKEVPGLHETLTNFPFASVLVS